MPKADGVSRLAATVLVVVLSSAIGRVQEPARVLSIAADGIDEVRQWDPVIDRLTNERTLAVRTVYDDPQVPGRRHEALSQYYRGLPVYGADVTRQTERGGSVSIFGNVYTGIDVNPAPSITVNQARDTIENRSGSTMVRTDDPMLMILPTLDGRFALVYRATMRNAVTYFLDAHDGRVLMEVNEISYQSAVGQGRGARGDLKKLSTTSGGSVYRSQDQLRPAPILTLDTRGSSATFQRLLQGGPALESDLAVDSDNDWTQAAVVDAHAHMGWAYDYFFKNHQYQGLNGRNAPMIGVVATRALLPSNAAFALPPFGPNGGGGMFFGEGPSGGPMTALDLTGHELMHGVTHFTVSQRTGRRLGGSLVGELGPTAVVVRGQTFPCTTTTFSGYPFLCDGGRYVLASDPAGAMNEGLSDIFGTAVEFAFHPSGTGALRAEYTMGEDLTDLGVERSLQNPASLAIDAAEGVLYPDHVSRRISFGVVVHPMGLLAVPAAIIGNSGFTLDSIDGGAVHWNSTILSHAFYLAIEGGQNRTSGRTVQGVGTANRTQIEQVFFRAVRDMLPSTVTFGQVGAILRQASVDLHGASSAAARAIDQALAAVGL
jgi:Zn-dependent metalloprotease